MPFQPGNNANPGGRPKTKIIRDGLMLAVNDDPEKPIRTTLDAIYRAHIKKALDGDVPAIKEIYDRIDGKVPQAVIGDDDEPGIKIDGLQLLLAAIDGKTRSV
jgi:Family of unknown function (DUF5681)